LNWAAATHHRAVSIATCTGPRRRALSRRSSAREPALRRHLCDHLAPKRNRERPCHQKFRPTLAEYHPPYAGHTRPRSALVHRGKAASLPAVLPHRSARLVHGRGSRASPVRSNKRDILLAPRFHAGGRTYGLCKATVRPIDFGSSDARTFRWAPACTAMQAKKITLGVHATINPSKKP
jgi:hypothetical protein